MRFSTLTGAAALSAAAMAAEMPVDEFRAAELYDSGLMHQKVMEKKIAHWEAEMAAGVMAPSLYPRLNATKCVNGVAEAIPGDPLHTFRCKNFDLLDFINHEDLGSLGRYQDIKSGSSAWGWTDPKSGREFVASGVYDGVSFIEILPEGRMLPVAFLPKWAALERGAYWTEIRPYKHYMVIGSELVGNGVQIFDMTKLLDLDASKGLVRLTNEEHLTGHFNETLPIGRSHNVVINEELNYGVAVGVQPRDEACSSGLHFFSLEDPSNPVSLGCDGQDGYTHDAQCLVYRGPHEKYAGREVCYAYNEDTLTIFDVTDKKAVKMISRVTYEGATYTHQGWVNDVNNQEYIFMDDEYDEDELAGPAADGYPVTYIWDIRDLENPKQTGLYKAVNKGIDHNQYKWGDYIYQSNYGSGMRVYDVSSVPQDPTGNSVCEVGFFDTYPEDDQLDGNGAVQFSGSWHSYAGFKSGYVFINTIERGAFLVKKGQFAKCPPKTCNADNCLRSMRSESVKGRLEESQEFCADFTDGWNAQVTAVPKFAQEACSGNVISRVSSACSCLPTATASP
jgi:choice-of-anchor B domain-containing protein